MSSPVLKALFELKVKRDTKDVSAAHSCLTKGLDWKDQDRLTQRRLQVRFLIGREEWPAICDAARRKVARLEDGRAMLSKALKEAEEARKVEEREGQERIAKENGWDEKVWSEEKTKKEKKKDKKKKEEKEDDCEFPEMDEEMLQEFITFYSLLNNHYLETDFETYWFVRLGPKKADRPKPSMLFRRDLLPPVTPSPLGLEVMAQEEMGSGEVEEEDGGAGDDEEKGKEGKERVDEEVGEQEKERPEKEDGVTEVDEAKRSEKRSRIESEEQRPEGQMPEETGGSMEEGRFMVRQEASVGKKVEKRKEREEDGEGESETEVLERGAKRRREEVGEPKPEEQQPERETEERTTEGHKPDEQKPDEQRPEKTNDQEEEEEEEEAQEAGRPEW